MERRQFLQTIPAVAMVHSFTQNAVSTRSHPVSADKLPRWRGFNLLEKFTQRRNQPYVEQDFEWMAGWGFDFVRLPTDYRCWTDSDDPYSLDEKVLKDIDQAVEWGQQYHIHVNLNLHRAPGYCVNPPKEPLNLWKDEQALKQFCFQWKSFAERYQGIPSERLSFDLLNEPAKIPEPVYEKVVRATVQAIREKDPKRLVIVDALQWGRNPVHSLADLGIAQSTRGYDPMRISHHKASWISGSQKWPAPSWPLKVGDDVIDKEWLREHKIKPFQELEKKGVGVHVGEWGCYNKTPHKVALAWMKDWLDLWQAAGWGWALWNFRGSFGILDSRRDDVKYDDYKGHKLDRKLLELLRND